MSDCLGKQSVEDFGDALLRMGDLDPVYVLLAKSKMDKSQKHRWCLAYWLFYHAGVASWLSEEEDAEMFWAYVLTAALNVEPPRTFGVTANVDRWPRSPERRHFRGAKCVEAVGTLRERTPEALVSSLSGNVPTPIPLKRVIDVATGWPQFGPWIAFKAADMLDRCLGVPVEFPDDLGVLYKEPARALSILVEQRGGQPGTWWRTLRDRYAETLAPPLDSERNRFCGPAEVETILCKWKSYLGGHYFVGKDSHEVVAGLKGWGSTAEQLAALPIDGVPV